MNGEPLICHAEQLETGGGFGAGHGHRVVRRLWLLAAALRIPAPWQFVSIASCPTEVHGSDSVIPAKAGITLIRPLFMDLRGSKHVEMLQKQIRGPR
jgi:hypothetical protein